MEPAADNWMNEEVEMRNKNSCCCCGCCGSVEDIQTDRQTEGRETGLQCSDGCRSGLQFSHQLAEMKGNRASER